MTNTLGNFSLSRASHIPGKEVVAIRRSAVLTVRINFMIIERKDIQPPVTGMPKTVRTTFVSNKGLNIPINIAKGEMKSTFFAIALRGISPAVRRKTGYTKKGMRPESSSFGKDTTKRIKIKDVRIFTLGSSLWTKVFL